MGRPRALAAAAVQVTIAGFVVGVLAGLLLGYSPVVLTTGSMSPAAPAGSLLLAATVPAEQVAPGDMLVMERPSMMLLTHRVTEVAERDGGLMAVTKGDANPVADPHPYSMVGDQQVVRLVVPKLGFVVGFVAGNAAWVVVALLALCVLFGLRPPRNPSPNVMPTAQRAARSAEGVDEGTTAEPDWIHGGTNK